MILIRNNTKVNGVTDKESGGNIATNYDFNYVDMCHLRL